MNYNRQPRLSRDPLLKFTGVLLIATVLAACKSPSKTEAGPPAAPTDRNASAATVGRVCTGLFTQTLQNGDVWVVGRPLTGDDGRPKEVVVSEMGIFVEPAAIQEGAIAWYSLSGKPLDGNTVECKQSALYARQLTQPNGSKTWVATTNQAAAIPQYWDAHALDPAGFGGVGLNYGTMPTANFAEMLDAAGKK